MKRTIAILLVVSVIVFCFVGCGKSDKTVSESTTGTITDSTTQNNSTKENRTTPETERTDDTARTFTNDMDDAIDKAGEAARDAGRAIGDAVTGDTNDMGTGMTGSR